MNLIVWSLFALCSYADGVNVRAPSKRLQSKIAGSAFAEKGKFPYYVAIAYHKKHIGGGSLIAFNWVLTTAFVVQEKAKNELRIVVTINIQNFNDLLWETCSREIFIHPQYQPRYKNTTNVILDHDIALIQTLKPKNNDPENVRPISIPYAFWPIPEDGIGTIAGFGRYNSTVNSHEKHKLKFRTLVVMSSQECKKIFPFLNMNLHFCTNSGGQNSPMQPCHGDEGGGFTYYDYDADKDILVGIFSASLACNGKKPAVYTPVSLYIDWINSTIETQNNNVNSDYICKRYDQEFECID